MRGNNKKVSLPLIISVLIGAPTAVWAKPTDNSAIVNADNQIRLYLGTLRQQYGEENNGLAPGFGEYFDTETGYLKSIGVDASILRKGIYSNARLDVSFGDTKYQGGLQNLITGTTTKYDSTTYNKIISLRERLGYLFAAGRSVAIGPYGEVGYQYWDRNLGDVDPQYGYDEIYQHGWAAAGALAQFDLGKRMVASLNASYGRTVGARIDTGGLSKSLGWSYTYNVGAALDYAVNARWHVSGTAEFTHFKFGHSATSQYGYMEPSSRTNQTSYTLGVGYRFK